MKSVISDLVNRIEGYGDDPDYNIKSIMRSEDEHIVIVIRLPQTKTAGDGQTEPGAQNEGN